MKPEFQILPSCSWTTKAASKLVLVASLQNDSLHPHQKDRCWSFSSANSGHWRIRYPYHRAGTASHYKDNWKDIKLFFFSWLNSGVLWCIFCGQVHYKFVKAIVKVPLEAGYLYQLLVTVDLLKHYFIEKYCISAVPNLSDSRDWFCGWKSTR